MFDEIGSLEEPRCEIAYVRLNPEHWDWPLAAQLLEAVGGQPCRSEAATVYSFATHRARDEALELLRRNFGWTVASPSDRRPWLPERPSRGNVFASGRGTNAVRRPASVDRINNLDAVGESVGSRDELFAR